MEEWHYKVLELNKLNKDLAQCRKKADELGLDTTEPDRFEFLTLCYNSIKENGRILTDDEIYQMGFSKSNGNSYELTSESKSLDKNLDDLSNMIKLGYCYSKCRNSSPYFDSILKRLPYKKTLAELKDLEDEILHQANANPDEMNIALHLIDLEEIKLAEKKL